MASLTFCSEAGKGRGPPPRRRKHLDHGLSAPALPADAHRVRYGDLKQITDVMPLFGQLDDLLHSAGGMREGRHSILLKLLLVKLYDEERGRDNPGLWHAHSEFHRRGRGMEYVGGKDFHGGTACGLGEIRW